MLIKDHTQRAPVHRCSHKVLFASLSALPVTILLLWAMTEINAGESFFDFVGIVATVMGTLGTVLFFLLFFRYQIQLPPTSARRWTILGVHCAIIILMLIGITWMGFHSPWCKLVLWGNYDIETASRTWIIAVLSFGSLTLIAGVLDFFRQTGEKPESKSMEDANHGLDDR